ncbi:hypothetical protein A15D_01949 [Alcanivorax sp. MD8A]|uniref:DUF3429 domain-containing protein n=1 Tax=Alcanivorax sp. MD8A TaxID=1177157 RepID=UPI000CB655AF|nr:DUF3429 domain-containing protein [Alcanivorax sp. MD8A]PNE02540.1 hypothetical protein A15D_01949 [Alcanivorax sp. MD8A]
MADPRADNIRRTRALTLVSLAPMYLLAMLAWADPWREMALMALVAYAAISLTFAGAIHWGRVLGQFNNSNQFPTQLFGVLAAFIGWAGLLLPREMGIPMLCAGLTFVWGTEQMLFSDDLPSWYRKLRNQLTGGAVLAMLIGWAAVMMPMF